MEIAMLRAAWPLWLLTAGCGASKGGDTGHGNGGAKGDDTGDQIDTGDTDAPPKASFWLLDANVTIAKGAVAEASSAITVTLLDQEAAALCSVSTAEARWTTGAEPPDPALYTWWAVRPLSWAKGCEDWAEALPEPFYLGVGDMHPEIVAVLGSLSGVADGAAATLNAAYASFDDGKTVLVFGAAGQDAAWGAKGDAATGAPLADGLWTIRPIYPFPVSAKR